MTAAIEEARQDADTATGKKKRATLQKRIDSLTRKIGEDRRILKKKMDQKRNLNDKVSIIMIAGASADSLELSLIGSVQLDQVEAYVNATPKKRAKLDAERKEWSARITRLTSDCTKKITNIRKMEAKV